MTGRTQMPEPAVAQHVIRPGSKDLTVKALLTALSPGGDSLSLHSFLCRALLYTVCLVILLQIVAAAQGRSVLYQGPPWKHRYTINAQDR